MNIKSKPQVPQGRNAVMDETHGLTARGFRKQAKVS